MYTILDIPALVLGRKLSPEKFNKLKQKLDKQTYSEQDRIEVICKAELSLSSKNEDLSAIHNTSLLDKSLAIHSLQKLYEFVEIKWPGNENVKFVKGPYELWKSVKLYAELDKTPITYITYIKNLLYGSIDCFRYKEHEDLCNISSNLGFYLPCEEVCFVSEKYEEVFVNEQGFLYNGPKGYFVKFRDGLTLKFNAIGSVTSYFS